MVGDFPVVRLLFPPDARTQRTDSDDVTLSVANSTKSLADDGTSYTCACLRDLAAFYGHVRAYVPYTVKYI